MLSLCPSLTVPSCARAMCQCTALLDQYSDRIKCSQQFPACHVARVKWTGLSGTGTKPGSGIFLKTRTETKPGIPKVLNQLPKPEPRIKPETPGPIFWSNLIGANRNFLVQPVILDVLGKYPWKTWNLNLYFVGDIRHYKNFAVLHITWIHTSGSWSLSKKSFGGRVLKTLLHCFS